MPKVGSYRLFPGIATQKQHCRELVRDAWPLALGHQRIEIDPKRCGSGADIPMGTDACGVAV